MAQLVFDGIVPSTALYTRPFPVPTNGQYLTLQVIGIPVAGTGTLTAQLETSQDGQSWANVNATAEVNAASLTTRQETPIYGSSSLTRIQGSMGRLRIVMNTLGDLAHVRVYAGVRGKRTARMFGFAVAEGCGCEAGGASPGRTRGPSGELVFRPPPTGGPPSPWPKKPPPPNSQRPPPSRGQVHVPGGGGSPGSTLQYAPYQGWGYPGANGGGGPGPGPSDCFGNCPDPQGLGGKPTDYNDSGCCVGYKNDPNSCQACHACNAARFEAVKQYCMCASEAVKWASPEDCFNANVSGAWTDCSGIPNCTPGGP